MTPNIPEGFKQVTPEAFFAWLKRDPRDIMPSHQSPVFTSWETKSRERVGWSLPGWREPGAPRVYAIKTAAQ